MKLNCVVPAVARAELFNDGKGAVSVRSPEAEMSGVSFEVLDGGRVVVIV